MRLPPAPIRTPISPDDVNPIDRSWAQWFRILTPGVRLTGTHANRPDAAMLLDGTPYYESDRKSFYMAVEAHWLYVNGFMTGTLAPDQRPVDLTADDFGFHFYATDPDEGTLFWEHYMWDGTAWVGPVL